MEKVEWREIFNHQPIPYLFFDFTVPIAIDNINIICQCLQNITALSNSLKGASRFPMLGVYVLSARAKCIFPLQSVKHNYVKLQISLESMQASQSISIGENIFQTDSLTEILQDAVKQYEKYFQSNVVNSEEWPQIQMIFFSAQTPQNFAKMVRKALPSVHLEYIRKVEAVILRGCGSISSASSLESKSDTFAENSPTLFENDETDQMISSLIHITEIDANVYQLESVMKQWLHDYSTDSDHLRLTVGSLTLRCDVRECLLSADALPVNGQFYIFCDGGASQHSVRSTATNRQASTSRVPVYSMDAVAVVQKEGICESVLFGHSYTATATRCWKIDWDDLDRNQQLFLAITQYLHEKGLVLLAKKKTAQVISSEKVLPTGFFAFFPSRNMLLIKSVAPGELILPGEEITEKEIPEDMAIEAKECLESLEHKITYNPLTITSGLYSYLNSSQTKRMRPTTSFVTPIIARDEDHVGGKKRKKMTEIPSVEISSKKRLDTSYSTEFMTASTLLKRRFTHGFD